MRRRAPARPFPPSVVLATPAILPCLFGALLSGGCQRHDKRVWPCLPKSFVPDIGPVIPKSEQQGTWQSRRVILGDTGFMAAVGPAQHLGGAHKRWDYYSIEVQLRTDATWRYVCFRRDLPISLVPPDLLSDGAAEKIVAFDAQAGVVTFTLGDSVYTYRLPKLQRSDQPDEATTDTVTGNQP